MKTKLIWTEEKDNFIADSPFGRFICQPNALGYSLFLGLVEVVPAIEYRSLDYCKKEAEKECHRKALNLWFAMSISIRPV